MKIKDKYENAYAWKFEYPSASVVLNCVLQIVLCLEKWNQIQAFSYTYSVNKESI